jgi:hypothetical protein
MARRVSAAHPETGRFAVKRLILLVAIGLLLAPVAHAGKVEAIGPRAGAGFDPDQFNFGGQMKLGPYGSSFHLVPVLEIGLSDAFTVFQFSFDVDWWIPADWKVFPYVGAGPSLALWDVEGGGTDAEVGLNLLGGLELPMTGGTSALVGEVRIGIGDIPDLKLMAGWNFNM